MSVFFSSDHHFFHEKIIKYCDRPFRDADHMNEVMLSKINDLVAPDDSLILVGDLSAGLGTRHEELKSIIGRMHGKKIMIRGNHDHRPDEWYTDAGIDHVVSHINLGGVLFIHYPLIEAISRGIDPSSLGVVEHVVHGHVHRVDVPDHDDHFNVAVDRHSFSPVDYMRAVPERLQTSFIDALKRFL